MLMPAPILAARPTANVAPLFFMAKVAAKSGASVDTEPSIKPGQAWQAGLHQSLSEPRFRLAPPEFCQAWTRHPSRPRSQVPAYPDRMMRRSGLGPCSWHHATTSSHTPRCE
jgi:hypothetical protein